MFKRYKTSTSLMFSIIIHVLILGLIAVFHKAKPDKYIDEINVQFGLNIPRPKLEKRMMRKKSRKFNPIRRDSARKTSMRNPKKRVSQNVNTKTIYTAVDIRKNGSSTSFLASTDDMPTGPAEPAGTAISRPIGVPVDSESQLIEFMGKMSGKRDIVYCLDVSASMSMGFDKLTLSKNYFRDSMLELRESDRFNIITFSSRPDIYMKEMQHATKENIEKALAYFRNFTRRTTMKNTETDLLVALEKAVKMQPAIIVLVADGLPTAGTINPDDIAEKFKKINSKSRIFAIGLGMSETEPGTYLLDLLAQASNGELQLIEGRTHYGLR